MVEEDLFDFLLLSLPDNDTHSHKYGPHAQVTSIANADRQIERMFHAGGGVDAFLDEHAMIIVADHSHAAVEAAVDLFAPFSELSVLPASGNRAGDAEIALCPSQRSAMIYALVPEARDSARPAPGRDGAGDRRRRPGDVAPGGRARARSPASAASCASPPAATCATRAASAGRSTVRWRSSARASRTACCAPTTTPTRSPASGRRSRARPPATCCSPPRPATSSPTGAASTTSAAAATARCTARTRWARWRSAASSPSHDHEAWSIADVTPMTLAHFGVALAPTGPGLDGPAAPDAPAAPSAPPRRRNRAAPRARRRRAGRGPRAT